MENSGQTLEAAAELAKSGNRTEARTITVQILKANPSDTSALWLLANVTSSVEERRKALTRLIQLKPNAEKAKAMLEAMDAPKPKESAPAAMTPATTITPPPTAGLKFIEAKDKYILPLTKTKTWFYELDGQPHTIEVKLNVFSGKTEIFRDKFLIKEQGHFSTGITHEFKAEGDFYVLFVRFRSLISYAFYLSVNRRSIETGEYLLNEPMPSWAWLFCIICGAIVIVSRGGAIPSLIAGWPMMMVVYVSRDPTKSLNRRVAECLAYTVGAWALFGLFILLLTR